MTNYIGESRYKAAFGELLNDRIGFNQKIEGLFAQKTVSIAHINGQMVEFVYHLGRVKT